MTEFEAIKERYRDITDEVVLCHSDTWWGNLIYNKKTGVDHIQYCCIYIFQLQTFTFLHGCLCSFADSMHLIDFDLCNFNYASTDLAYYFSSGLLLVIKINLSDMPIKELHLSMLILEINIMNIRLLILIFILPTKHALLLTGQAELIPGKVFRFHPMRESERVLFIRAYLEKRGEIQGQTDPVTDEQVDKLLMLTKPAELVNK